MIDFGLVGTGWRAEFFLRIARACPEQFSVTGLVARNREKTAALAQRFGTPVFDSLRDLAEKGRPLFFVSSKTWWRRNK